MEARDRIRIQRNIVNLSNNIKDLAPLYNELLRRRIIFKNDLEKLEKNYPVRQEQAQEFFLRYTKRGPDAFRILVEVLRSIGFIEEADELEKNDNDIEPEPSQEIVGQSSNDVIPSSSSVRVKFGSPILGMKSNLKMEDLPPLDIKIKPANLYNMGVTITEAYQMMSSPRGYALIINNMHFLGNPAATRTGAEKDSEHLECLFKCLHFNVTNHMNAKKDEILSEGGIIDTFTNQFTFEDCCIVAVMSHGKEGYFMTSDHERANDINYNRISIWEEFLPKFNNRHCPQLRNKPKIFIIQACRGDIRDRGVVQQRKVSSTTTDSGAVVALEEQIESDRIPSFEDMLVCQSTVPGFVSNRDTERGTWYIESVCRIFCEFAHEMELTRMLKKVGLFMRSISSEFGEKQMCSYVDTGFHYELYFNPELFSS